MGLWLVLILAAPCIGSFLGVLVIRLPAGQKIAWARSACPACGHTLAPIDLVPILSYGLGGGACRYCAAPISRFYPGIELAALLVPVWAGTVDPDGLALLADCLLGWWLLALAAIDARHMILPDVLTLPLAATGVILSFWLDPGAVFDHLAGLIAGYLLFLGVALAYRRLRQREGLGRGDAKLLGAAGAWVTWHGLGAVILVAAFSGLAGAGLRALGGQPITGRTAMPFGPFLAIGFWLVWLYGVG